MWVGLQADTVRHPGRTIVGLKADPQGVTDSAATHKKNVPCKHWI
jgi:hypothetical protein